MSAQLPRRLSRRTRIFIGGGLLAYAIAILASIPASIVLPSSTAIVSSGGSLWRGSAVLADGSSLGWRWAPIRSVISLGFALDWTVTGAGSDLAGRALLRRDSTRIDETSGTAAGALLQIALPSLPFGCTLPMQVNIDRIVLGGESQQLAGVIRAATGSCAPRSGGFATLVPPLTAHFMQLGNASDISVSPTAASRHILVHGTLTRAGQLGLRVTREGARVLPFAAPPQGLSIDTTL